MLFLFALLALLALLQPLDLLHQIAILTLEAMRVLLEDFTTFPETMHSDPSEILIITVTLSIRVIGFVFGTTFNASFSEVLSEVLGDILGNFVLSVEVLSASVMSVEGVFGIGGLLIGCGLCFDVEAVWVMRLVIVFRIKRALLGKGPMMTDWPGLHFISIYY